MAFGLGPYSNTVKRESFQDICEEIDPIFKGWKVVARSRSTPHRTTDDCKELVATKGVEFCTRFFVIPASFGPEQRAETLKREIMLLADHVRDISKAAEIPQALFNFLESLI